MASVDVGHAYEEGAADRLRVERLLERYPALSEGELEALLHWFDREASALDVALVASNERIGRGYGQFKAEHIDRFDIWDGVRASLFVAALGATIVVVLWLAV